MDGAKHETMRATLNEHVADTYLKWDNAAEDAASTATHTKAAASYTAVSTTFDTTISLPYQDVNEDGLNKASDYLSKALRILEPTFSSAKAAIASESTSMELDALSQQLYRIHYKLVRVSLRLADYHFIKYWSSSIIQALRMASRHLAETVSLLYLYHKNDEKNSTKFSKCLHNANLQYAAVWARCGHFARSFAGDSLWRERGHAMGEDVISLLQEAENACRTEWSDKPQHTSGLPRNDSLTSKTHGRVTLFSLSPLIEPREDETLFVDCREKNLVPSFNSSSDSTLCSHSLREAEFYLDSQSVLKRDKLRILVAAALCYDRACLKKQLGDTCNEIGKIVLSSAQNILTNKLDAGNDSDKRKSVDSTALCLLHSAEFWFEEGLHNFEQYHDVCNVALLRCNLCQCCKVKANANLNHATLSAEQFLQKAIEHLKFAHTALGEREKDPKTWDVISDQLAAAFLVLGVRRRQSILGGAGCSSSSGIAPAMTDTTTTATLRLSPGEERSILQPMESALRIYKKLNNSHQAAATHYQLALFYTKIWMCQRDEAKTREKLSAAFHHYSASHSYFFKEMKGNEPIFVILTLDLSNLYSAVSGPECLSKALSCCFDAIYAFSAEAVSAAVERRKVGSGENNEVDWFEKMKTLAKSLEEQVFRVLHSLVKLERGGTKFKEMYRCALRSLRSKVCASGSLESPCIEETIYPIHQILTDIKNSYDKYFISK